MAPIKPLMKASGKTTAESLAKPTKERSFKERMVASGKKSKNVIDTRKDKNGMKAETNAIFKEMQSEKGKSTMGLPSKKGKNPAVSAAKDPGSVLRKMPGPATKFEKGNKKIDTSKLSKKSPRVTQRG